MNLWNHPLNVKFNHPFLHFFFKFRQRIFWKVFYHCKSTPWLMPMSVFQAVKVFSFLSILVLYGIKLNFLFAKQLGRKTNLLCKYRGAFILRPDILSFTSQFSTALEERRSWFFHLFLFLCLGFFSMEIINFERRFPLGFSRKQEEIMRRANEIKILDTKERKLKTKSFSMILSVSCSAMAFNLNQLSCESFILFCKKTECHQKRGKMSSIISIFTDFFFVIRFRVHACNWRGKSTQTFQL